MSKIQLTDPVWELQPGEPNLWFSRFELFRLAGPRRSLRSIYNGERVAGRVGGKAPQSPVDHAPAAWDNAALKWRWRERAEAWDAAERLRRRGVLAAELDAARANYRNLGATIRQRAQGFLDLFPLDQLVPVDLIRVIEGAQRLEIGLAEESAVAELERQMNEIEGRLHAPKT